MKNEFKVEMENQKQFEDRLEKLGCKLRIKDDTIRSYLEIDTRVDEKRVHHIRRYNKNNKQEAFKQFSEIQQKCIKELTIDWNQKNKKGLIESKEKDKITDVGDFSQK